MKAEDKSLLLKDLCARLLYGVQVKVNIPYVNVDFNKDYDYITNLQNNCILTLNNISDIQKITDDIKPYLRPMSSMTEEERKEYKKFDDFGTSTLRKYEYQDFIVLVPSYERLDWLLSHHFDFRCPSLISLGLAIEVTDSNNPYKE